MKSLFVEGSLLYLDVLILVSAHDSCFQDEHICLSFSSSLVGQLDIRVTIMNNLKT